MRTGEAATRSSTGRSPSKRPKDRTPVGHICTQAEQRTHSGSCIGSPLLAKLMMSMPWWQTEVQTLQEMHLDFSAKMRNFEKRVYTCMRAARGHANRHQTRPENQKYIPTPTMPARKMSTTW